MLNDFGVVGMKRVILLCSAAILLSAPTIAQTLPNKPSSPPSATPGPSNQPPAPQPPAAPSAVACDVACVRGSAERAVQVCAPRIEAEAPGDFEWLVRPYGTIFQQADAPDQAASPIARYRGDSIRFLSPQKEWVRAIYECAFDTSKGQAVQVRVRLGVLGKASAVPPVPAPPQAQVQAPQAAPGPAAKGQAAPAAAAAPAAGAPTSDRRKVGEVDDVSVLQVKPRKDGR